MDTLLFWLMMMTLFVVIFVFTVLNHEMAKRIRSLVREELRCIEYQKSIMDFVRDVHGVALATEEDHRLFTNALIRFNNALL